MGFKRAEGFGGLEAIGTVGLLGLQGFGVFSFWGVLGWECGGLGVFGLLEL